MKGVIRSTDNTMIKTK